LVSGFTRKFQFMDQVKLFLRDVKMEMKKVTWPTRKETLAATAMVIILSVLVAFFLGILDVALAKLVSTVLGR
jgi:preprotein translocase subunit SecE